jgi:type II secretory ATPase GspE/PulE/Tfp pilus assembly ATPase PilB-like protein
MGVQPYLIASAARGILGQRLVRKVCTACGEPVKPSEAQLAQIGRELGAEMEVKLYRGRGCSECNGTGYRGRTAILELLTVDEDLRDLILQRASASAIRRQVASKMQTMREAGWLKVARGITTPEEVIRATQMEEQFRDSDGEE